MDPAICWGAACLVFWSGGSPGLLTKALDMVCTKAHLTVPEEVALKGVVHKMLKGARKDRDGTD